MSLWEALLLGVIQGLTEFLPVSSSAHLAIAHWLLGWQMPKSLELAFDVALHAGTLVALLAYFGREWVQLFTAREFRKLAGLVIVACVPGGVAGVLFEEKAETLFRSPLRIAALMVVMGVAMGVADRLGPKRRQTEECELPDALTIGVSQALAIMPGVSRSGITMSTGLLRGFTRESAARISFLISFPIIAGATMWKARHFEEIIQAGSGAALLVGVVSAAVCGYVAIDRLLRYLQTKSLAPFVIYRLLFAVGVVIAYLMRGGE